MTNLITVTAQIGKCIYHIEMEQKSSYAEMLTEVENALEIKNKPIKITVINAAEQVLPGLSQKISDGAKEILEQAEVNVLNSSKVIALEKNKVIIESKGEKEIDLVRL